MPFSGARRGAAVLVGPAPGEKPALEEARRMAVAWLPQRLTAMRMIYQEVSQPAAPQLLLLLDCDR